MAVEKQTPSESECAIVRTRVRLVSSARKDSPKASLRCHAIFDNPEYREGLLYKIAIQTLPCAYERSSKGEGDVWLQLAALRDIARS